MNLRIFGLGYVGAVSLACFTQQCQLYEKIVATDANSINRKR